MANDSDIIIQATFKYTEEGAEEVISANQAVEESAAEMSSNMESASSGFATMGEASITAAGGVRLSEEALGNVTEATATASKSMGEVGGSFVEIGKTSTDAAASTEEAAASFAKVDEATAGITKGTDAAAGGIVAVGTASEKGADSAEELARSNSAIEQTFQEVKESSAKAEEGLTGAGKGASEAGGGFNLLSGQGMMTAMMFVQMAQMVGQAIGALAQMEAAVIHTAGAFGQLMNDGMKANQELATLSNTWAAAKFGTQNIDNIAQHLLMAGEDADTANKEITRVADAVAAMGGSAQQIEPVIDKLHSMQKEGSITDQDMQTLAKDGVAGYDALAAGLTAIEGKNISVAEAVKRVKENSISGHEAYQAMLTGMMKYSGAAQEQSNELSSQWQRFGEEAGPAIGPFIDELAKLLKNINDAIEAVKGLKQAFDSMTGGSGSMGGNLMDSANTILGLYTNPIWTGAGIAGQLLTGHAEGIIDSPIGHFATVGENGPETMFIPQGASIFPNSGGGSSIPSLSSMMNSGGEGSSGGQPITINVALHVDGRQMAQVVIPHIAPMTRALIGGKQ